MCNLVWCTGTNFSEGLLQKKGTKVSCEMLVPVYYTTRRHIPEDPKLKVSKFRFKKKE